MKKRGFTLIEVTIVVAVMIVMGVYVALSLSGRKREFDVRTTAQQIVTTLRFAQSKAVLQSSNTAWGVHFDNTVTSSPFYVLYSSSTYSQSVESDNRYALPKGVLFDTSTVPSGGSKNVYFNLMTGAASASTSVRIYLDIASSTSSTISVASSGVVSY